MADNAVYPKLTVYTDGAARGNPGPAGIGIVIFDQAGAVVQKLATGIGRATNNRAEYMALIAGLEAALRLGTDDVVVKSDSELMVRQLNGQYAVRNADLLPLFRQAKSLLQRFRSHSISHIPREQNRLADSLANKAIDEGLR